MSLLSEFYLTLCDFAFVKLQSSLDSMKNCMRIVQQQYKNKKRKKEK